MGTNGYFNHFNSQENSEQRLYEDLLVESIKVNGHNVYYMPREMWDETDRLFGENVQSYFKKAYKIEMYILNVEGWGGDQDFFSKFQLELRDDSNFMVSKRSFFKYIPSTVTERPREGDLIYVPVMNKIFEIKFVETDTMFFTKGHRNPFVFELKCELFRYSNEVIESGVDRIDKIQKDATYTIEVSVAPGAENYHVGETVYQGNTIAFSTATAKIARWEPTQNKLYLYQTTGLFAPDLLVRGATSNTQRMMVQSDTMGDFVFYDMSDNKQIQNEADDILDLSEKNPFGMP